jgi:hypothetical protein
MDIAKPNLINGLFLKVRKRIGKMRYECDKNVSTINMPPRLNKIINIMMMAGLDISRQEIITINGKRPGDLNIDITKDPGIEICDGIFKKKMESKYLIYSKSKVSSEIQIYGILLQDTIQHSNLYRV